MEKLKFKNSLSFTMLVQMGILVSIIVMAMTSISYLFIYENYEDQTLDKLEKYVVERGKKESFIFQLAKNNQDIWSEITDEKNSADNKAIWTGLSYNAADDEWRLSGVTLVNENSDPNTATSGNDKLLTDVIKRVLDDHLDGAFNMIVLEDGRIIAHPQKMAELQKADNDLSIEKLNDPDLSSQYTSIMNSVKANGGAIQLIDDETTEAFIVATKIHGPDWWFVTVYPEELIEAPVLEVAIVIFLIGAVGLLVVLFALYFVLSKTVINPLKEFVIVSNYVAGGNYDLKHIDLPVNRPDEVGLLARTFHTMEKEIHNYSVDMEQKICERTKELDAAKELAEKQARTDPLTGLPNRRAFMEYSEIELGKIKRSKRNLTAMMLDIDKFKVINDTHGHAVGDEVIKTLGELIKETLRTSDFSARIGGEEFVVLLTDTNAETGKDIAEKLREKIEETIVKLPDQNLRFTVSLGVAQYSITNQTIDDLLASADQALYEAKDGGRNCVVSATRHYA